MIWLAVIILLLIVLFLSAMHLRYPNLRETLGFLGTGIGLTAAIASAVFTYLQVAEATKQSQLVASQMAEAGRQNQLALTHRQQEEAFRLIDKYNDLPLQIASDFVRSFKGKTPEEINVLHNSNPDAAEALRSCMNFFENAALSIRSDFANESISCEHFRDTGVLYYGQLKEYIAVLREKTENPDTWKHHQWLYERWSNGCPGLTRKDQSQGG